MLKAALLAGAAVLSASPAAAEPGASEWAKSSKAEARLVAAGPTLAGFEIALAPGAITYWRDPGEAGLPPSFDFAGSANLAKAEVVFPAPTRIAEPDGGEAFGYAGGVVFPIRVTPADAAQPVGLKVMANYAVCEKICVPAEAKLSLELPRGEAHGRFASAVAAALAKAPKPIAAAALGGALTTLDAAHWRFCPPAEAGPPHDLFVEAPEGWFFTEKPDESAAGRDCFRIALEQKPSGAALPVTARLTLTGASGAVETEMALPPSP